MMWRRRRGQHRARAAVPLAVPATDGEMYYGGRFTGARADWVSQGTAARHAQNVKFHAVIDGGGLTVRDHIPAVFPAWETS